MKKLDFQGFTNRRQRDDYATLGVPMDEALFLRDRFGSSKTARRWLKFKEMFEKSGIRGVDLKTAWDISELRSAT